MLVLAGPRTFPSDASCAAVGWTGEMAGRFLKSKTGREVKELWDQAPCEEDIQGWLNTMISVLLLHLHGRDHSRRPTYFFTHGGSPSEHADIDRKHQHV